MNRDPHFLNYLGHSFYDFLEEVPQIALEDLDYQSHINRLSNTFDTQAMRTMIFRNNLCNHFLEAKYDHYYYNILNSYLKNVLTNILKEGLGDYLNDTYMSYFAPTIKNVIDVFCKNALKDITLFDDLFNFFLTTVIEENRREMLIYYIFQKHLKDQYEFFIIQDFKNYMRDIPVTLTTTKKDDAQVTAIFWKYLEYELLNFYKYHYSKLFDITCDENAFLKLIENDQKVRIYFQNCYLKMLSFDDKELEDPNFFCIVLYPRAKHVLKHLWNADTEITKI